MKKYLKISKIITVLLFAFSSFGTHGAQNDHTRTAHELIKLQEDALLNDLIFDFEREHFKNTRQMITGKPENVREKFEQEKQPLLNQLLFQAAEVVNTGEVIPGDTQNVDFVRALLDAGANVNATQELGRTPLHDAAAKGGNLLVKLLLDRGADVDKTAANGSTALHHAAASGSFDTVQTLVNRGASCKVETIAHKKPIDIALAIIARRPDAANQYNEIIELLANQGSAPEELPAK